MSVRVRAVGLAAGMLVALGAGLFAGPVAAADTPDGFTIEDPRITESSGLAASRTHKGIYWTHNDSAHSPKVYAVDSRTGRTVAAITFQGVELRDVEAISIGPDGNVYVGDIGDNLNGTWPEVWIYRFPEPKKLRDMTVTPTRFTVQYADGPRDAESMMVHPKTGRVWIVSKSDNGKGGLYAGPEKLSANGVNTFRRTQKIGLWATDAAFSPDGTRLMVRGYFNGTMYRWKNDKATPVGSSVPVPIMRQGESVTFTPDGRAMMFGSEGTNSGVEAVEPEGEQRPESVIRADEKAGNGGGDHASGAGSDGEGPDQQKVVIGGVTFAVALALWLGVRRMFRRRA